jgi:hypothetical protein
MQRSRRALLHTLTLSLAGLALSATAGCGVVNVGSQPSSPAEAETTPAESTSRPATSSTPGGSEIAEEPEITPPAAPERVAPALAPSTPGTLPTVSVPATPTPAPPTPIPTPTPRPRPTRALVTVPYYSQRIGRLNYCLPTSIAMVADRYGCLPADVAGTPDRAPRFVADVAYGYAKQQIAALDEEAFKALWEEIGTDPLGGLIWNVFAANGRDLAAGMSPALAYLVLRYAFDISPVLGTLDECLVALADDVPSILFGTYGALRRADGMPGNVEGYTGDHALVLVGIDYDKVLVNDPLPSDKTRYSGERGRSTASLRAVRFDLASVRGMTRGDGGKPRGDCFMVPPPGTA